MDGYFVHDTSTNTQHFVQTCKFCGKNKNGFGPFCLCPPDDSECNQCGGKAFMGAMGKECEYCCAYP